MDIEAFFREQDKRMSLPDDNFDEYLRRMGTYRRSREDLGPNKALTTTSNVPDLPIQESSNAPQMVLSAEQRSAERLSEFELSEASKQPPGKRDITKEMGLPSNFEDVISLDQSTPNEDAPSSPTSHSSRRSSPQIRKRKISPNGQLDEQPQKKRASVTPPFYALSPPVEEASPMILNATSVTGITPPDPGPVSSSEAHISPRGPKRKASQDGLGPPSKKQPEHPQPLRRTPSPSIEEISSFSACSKIKSSPEPRPIPKGKSGAKFTNRRKIPALDLRPVILPTSNTVNLDGPATSPIENSSAEGRDSESRKDKAKGAIQAGPSKLYLEVKERVAQHSKSIRRDKVHKLAKVGVPAKRTNGTTDDESPLIDISSSSPAPPSSDVNIPTTSNTRTITGKGPTSNTEKPKSKAAKRKKKEKPAPVTPLEYAMKLQDKICVAADESSRRKYLFGLSILYIGGDMQYASEKTRGRMDIIVRNGGNLVPKYDASVVTHIVTDAQMRPTLHALGLKRLSEIPDHIPTVTWNWVVSRMGKPPVFTKEGLRIPANDVWMYAAFGERMDAGLEPGPSVKGKGKITDAGDSSNISEFTQPLAQQKHTSRERSLRDTSISEEDIEERSGRRDATKVPLSPPASSTHLSKPLEDKQNKSIDDPLSGFYAKARAEEESSWSRHELEVTPSSDIEIEEPAVPKKRGWTCDTKEVQRQTCVNQDIIDKLQELKELHEAKQGDDEHWRVFNYSKCIRALRNHPKRIESFAEARSIRGVGEKTAAKIMEIIETGGLRRIVYERTEDVAVSKLFQGVYGVGPATAYQWYAAGCRSLDDIVSGKYGVKPTPVQEIGIRFYDDINDRMPREEVKEIFDLIKPIALEIDPKLFIEVMGSYRRGKANCGDIDILITRPPDDGKTHKGVLSRLLRELHTAGVLTEDLALPDDPVGLEATYRGLCKVTQKKGSRLRRIDLLTVPWKSRGAALLYFTGDAIFNRAIRMKAHVMGYSLNHRGLFGGVVRNPRDGRAKLHKGTLVASETEREIFEILNVPWQEPHERVRG